MNNKNTDFSRYVFTDETTFKFNDIPKYHSRLPSSRPKALKHSCKYPLKVNVWGGISFEGPTDFVVSLKRFLKLKNKIKIYFERFLLKTWTLFCTGKY